MRRLMRFVLRWCVRLVIVVLAIVVALRWVNPPINWTQWTAQRDHGTLSRSWVSLDAMGMGVARAAVAAEDARFCDHHGFDIEAIRAAWADNAARGASTISQQTAKNVFLWQGRSWTRKGLEAGFTVLIELIWGKRRILEVYLNVAEFDTATFGAEAGAQAYFGTSAADLGPRDAARLVTVLPNPKARSAAALGTREARRARRIADGAATLAKAGRDRCFQPATP